MFGEHIEAYADLMAENGDKVTEANLNDLAMGVADIAFAQGLISDEGEIDLAVEKIKNEARYLLNLEVTA
jgi:hypothetical protein